MDTGRRYRIHTLILALLQHLPATGSGWSEDQQRRFMAALEANVRLLYEVTPSRKRHRPFETEPPY